jgi:hypothetical protein
MTKYSPPRTITFGFLSQLGVAMIACHLIVSDRSLPQAQARYFRKKGEQGEKERDDRTEFDGTTSLRTPDLPPSN